MTGPKLNQKSFVVGERSGTKATAKYVRASASKAREVLDLIRGLDVRSADQVLQFTERHIARDVRNATGWRNKLGYVFGRPGWQPANA